MISQFEFGGILEYQIQTKIKLEAGVGAHFLPIPPSRSIYYTGGGYTIRAGVRFMGKSRTYFNPLIFYRYMEYDGRWYHSIFRTDFSDGVFEPAYYRLDHVSNGGADRSWNRNVKNEKKQVVALQLLIGQEVLWFKKMPVDIYCGFGGVFKYKKQEITSEKDGDVITIYSPVKKETISGFLPTVQAGFQITLF